MLERENILKFSFFASSSKTGSVNICVPRAAIGKFRGARESSLPGCPILAFVASSEKRGK